MAKAVGIGSDGSPLNVAVCALTFRRPRGLASLLESLAQLENPGPNCRVRVVIVDNDPEQSARQAVEGAATTMPWEIEYATEARRGIPFGRNRAVAVAGQADFVAFLDDDEIACREWLAELLRVQRATGADVVTGVVLPDFEVDPPTWIVDGDFFERRRFPTGHRLPYARTSNVLIAAPVIAAAGPAPFAEALALNGGDDTHFFMRAHDQGFSIVWADDAVVHETIPASRLSARWLLMREYRRGNTLSLCLRDLHDSPGRRVQRVGRGLLEIGRGVGQGLIGALRGRAAMMHGLKHAWFGAGLLVGLVGVQYDEYRVTHGN